MASDMNGCLDIYRSYTVAVKCQTGHMNPPKCDEYDYINFLMAAQQVCNNLKASKTHPAGDSGPDHDACMRLLQRIPPDSGAL